MLTHRRRRIGSASKARAAAESGRAGNRLTLFFCRCLSPPTTRHTHLVSSHVKHSTPLSQNAAERASAEEALAPFRGGVASIGACKVRKRGKRADLRLRAGCVVACCVKTEGGSGSTQRDREKKKHHTSHTLPDSQSLLDASTSPYACLLAASSLLKTVTDAPLDLAVRRDARAYFLTYLETRAASLAPFVAASLVQLVARLTKLSWYDDDDARSTPDAAAAAVRRARERGDATGYAAGFKLLAGLVAEFNVPCPGRTLTQHRCVFLWECGSCGRVLEKGLFVC